MVAGRRAGSSRGGTLQVHGQARNEPPVGSPEEREATRKAAASLPDEWRVQVSVSAVPAGLIEAAFDGPGGAHGSATCREGHLDDVVKYLEAVLREYAERGQS